MKSRELNRIAEFVNDNYKKRKIAIWGDSTELREILQTEYGIAIDIVVTLMTEIVNNKTIYSLDYLNGKSKEFYLIAFGRNYEDYYDCKLREYGYTEVKDFIYRRIKPIILEQWDCSSGEYNDIYGNHISQSKGVLKKVIFRGYENHINIDDNVVGLENVYIEVGANSELNIRDWTRFIDDCYFIFEGFNGSSRVYINYSCRFNNVFFRLINAKPCSSVVINSRVTTERGTCFHANSGKGIVIGKDCMLSTDIQFQAGDGHSLFDIETGKNKNTLYDCTNNAKNWLILGNHVWVGARCFLLNGTYVEDGSVIGANSTVKGMYKNNVVVAGNPAKQVKENVAWARDGIATNIEKCGPYRHKTGELYDSIKGKKVLVIGGTRFMGIRLVWELFLNGNDVTIANRGRVKDRFGNCVNRIQMDLDNPYSVKSVFENKYFDVIFDDLAYCSNYVREILENIQCEKYIQLSSVRVYEESEIYPDLSEDKFDPTSIELKWENPTDNYAHGKRMAEATVAKQFSAKKNVRVRIPYVTKTERLYYFCSHIVNGIPMNIEDIDLYFSFVREQEVGEFLPWIAARDYTGAINFASKGVVSYKGIIEYIENKTGKKAIISKEGEPAPFNWKKFELNVSKVEALGYQTTEVDSWFWNLLDEYIVRAQNDKRENNCFVGIHDSLSSNNRINSMRLVDWISEDKCTGCSACVNVCPIGAIKMYSNKYFFDTPMIDDNKCIHCQLCKKICPVSNHKEDNLRIGKNCYAIMANDEIREKSSSGGAFTLLAESIFNKGGLVCGASWTDDYQVKHIFISSLDEIDLLRGSKYVQSKIGDTYKKTKDFLNEGRHILFVGLPCQISGLHSYLNKDYENLITVDLLCRGIASNELFKKYITEDYPDLKITRINFKEKKPLGWGATTAYEFSDGNVEKTNIHNSVWMNAYLADIMDRESCYSCKFASDRRIGDISIGDFWGIENYAKGMNDNKGTSIIITSSEKGESLIKSISSSCKQMMTISVENAKKHNSALFRHVIESDKRALFYENLNKMPFIPAVDRTLYGKKFDVGIVGWWYNLNYGGTITYYALNMAIKRMGYSVLMIRRSESGPRMPIDNTIPMKFAKKHYNISRLYTSRDMHWINYSCKAFVSGSDQLWNPHLEDYSGSEYFLAFVNNHNIKVSYASSFGNVESIPQNYREKYITYIKRFDGISVREDYAVNLCKEFFDIDAKHVCDPIFLCAKEEYEALGSESLKFEQEDFVLNFFLDPTEKMLEASEYVGSKLNISHFENFTDLQGTEERKKIFAERGVNAYAEIEDLLKAYTRAKFVITDSFHGTCLAIIFNKPFISLANKKRGEKRFISLLNCVGLLSRLVSEVDEIFVNEALLNDIDFDKVNNIIQSESNVGIKWLKEQLEKMY